jgi:nucleotide-binding universal stress UspA family protein
MDAPELEAAFDRGERLLHIAAQVSKKLAVEAEPLLRIDDDFAQAITRASREQKASLIIMGWGNRTGLRARLFGNVIDSVLWSSHCTVAVTRLLDSPLKIQRILVPIDNPTSEELRPVRFAQILAETNQAGVTLMQVCDRHTSAAQIESDRAQLSVLAAQWMPQGKLDIQIIPDDDVVRAIATAARAFDLVILRFRPQRTAAGLAIGDVTNQLVQQLTCSVVMLGEPQRIEGK